MHSRVKGGVFMTNFVLGLIAGFVGGFILALINDKKSGKHWVKDNDGIFQHVYLH
jgi:uncharacterized membrane protein YeaQ/YmgE (transglycosylase-associated protein family)